MHPNAIHSRLSSQLTDAEARLSARMDLVEAKLDQILRAAGLADAQPALEAPPIDVELVEAEVKPGKLARA